MGGASRTKSRTRNTHQRKAISDCLSRTATLLSFATTPKNQLAFKPSGSEAIKEEGGVERAKALSGYSERL